MLCGIQKLLGERKEISQCPTYREGGIEYDRGESHGSSNMGKMNIGTRSAEENIPVRAFVSIVRRTKRNIMKLEKRPASLRVHDSYGNINPALRSVKEGGWMDYEQAVSSRS